MDKFNFNESFDNPWIINNTTEIIDTPWINVKKHEVLNPAGKPGIYTITHFKNYAIGILPIDSNGYTWIVGQYRLPINAYSWEIPEGGGLRHLAPLDSAKRELLEETGIIAKKWQMIQTMHLSNSATDEFAYLYIAQDLEFTQSEPEETEDLQIRKIHFNDLYQAVKEQKITDSLTVAAVIKAKLMILEGELNIA